VAVVEANEVLRRGVVACLADDRGLDVTPAAPDGAVSQEFDVAVVSSEAAAKHRFPCPIVVCSDERGLSPSFAAENEVAAVLPRGSMTAAQLQATVHAAVTGLTVNPPIEAAGEQLDPRSASVLELIADGLSTREIADRLNYSERTIKKLISSVEQTLDARNRAHAVALGIRRGVI